MVSIRYQLWTRVYRKQGVADPPEPRRRARILSRRVELRHIRARVSEDRGDREKVRAKAYQRPRRRVSEVVEVPPAQPERVTFLPPCRRQ